jgi:glycosyltransferase involved in cell wall biosynthesis
MAAGGTVAFGVVIPTRDRPEELSRAVRSVLDQDSRTLRIEVVVVDDGSRVPVADLPVAADPRVRVVRNETPSRPATARNRGMDALDTDFVGFLDDDDVYLPNKALGSVQCLTRHPDAAMLYHPVNPRHSEQTGSCHRMKDPVRRALSRRPMHLNGIVLRQTLARQVRFDPGLAGAEDVDFVLRVAPLTPVVELDRILARRAHRQGSETAISLWDRIDGNLRVRERHAGLFDREARAYLEYRLGWLYLKAGRRGPAAACFARAAANRPSWSLPWKALARVGRLRLVSRGQKPEEGG